MRVCNVVGGATCLETGRSLVVGREGGTGSDSAIGSGLGAGVGAGAGAGIEIGDTSVEVDDADFSFSSLICAVRSYNLPVTAAVGLALVLNFFTKRPSILPLFSFFATPASSAPFADAVRVKPRGLVVGGLLPEASGTGPEMVGWTNGDPVCPEARRDRNIEVPPTALGAADAETDRFRRWFLIFDVLG